VSSLACKKSLLLMVEVHDLFLELSNDELDSQKVSNNPGIIYKLRKNNSIYRIAIFNY
jgi:hypothetical protein